MKFTTMVLFTLANGSNKDQNIRVRIVEENHSQLNKNSELSAMIKKKEGLYLCNTCHILDVGVLIIIKFFYFYYFSALYYANCFILFYLQSLEVMNKSLR